LTLPTFASLGLAEPILRALDAQGYKTPTPIQVGAIPQLLDGHDLLGIAQTGSGKTAAFSLPILQHLAATPTRQRPFYTRVLILAPTRELATQIDTAIRTFAAGQRIFTCVILGGVGRRPQEERMRRGPDIVVGTPGRVRDLMATGHLKLDEVTHLVLDEADRMLDLGFIRDIRKIVAAVPPQRQSLLFSATMPGPVEELAQAFLRNPRRVEIEQAPAMAPKIEQRVHFVESDGKKDLLTRLLQDSDMSRVIVFTRTKQRANRVAELLDANSIPAEAMHGNKSQSAREKSLDLFRRGRVRVLVATDLASRGIDVQGVTHVINFDLPVEPESYVHRIGRTARAGAEGVAISFCDGAERGALRAIEKLTGAQLQAIGGRPVEIKAAPQAIRPLPKGRNWQRGRGGDRRGRAAA